MLRHFAIILSALAATAGNAAPACTASSGPHTTALVELYTSEGCSSCPPADDWLSRTGRARRSGSEFVPLALHVPYWDDLGWRDVFAQPAFAARQSRLVAANGHHTSYTPQIFVAGVDVPAWHAGDAEAEIRRIEAQPAAAHITLRTTASADSLTIDAEAATLDPSRATAFHIAITESGLISTVAAGENRGATLRHDYVLRRLLSALPLKAGRLAERVAIPLDPAWRFDRLDIAAFVDDDATGRVLQAVHIAPCVLDR
jgi:hypothetical protein